MHVSDIHASPSVVVKMRLASNWVDLVNDVALNVKKNSKPGFQSNAYLANSTVLWWNISASQCQLLNPWTVVGLHEKKKDQRVFWCLYMYLLGFLSYSFSSLVRQGNFKFILNKVKSQSPPFFTWSFASGTLNSRGVLHFEKFACVNLP